MDEIEIKIIEQLAKEEKMKAKQIAKNLNITRREVNQCLYYKLTDVCKRDMFFFWSLKQPITSEKVKMIIEIMNKPVGPSKERCEYCMSYKRELCNGKGHICENFEPAPHIDDDDLKNYPKEGDATRIRMKVGEKKEKNVRRVY